MKVCTSCGIAKPLDAFGRCKRDGIQGRCKSCLVAKALAWNKSNRDKKNAFNRASYQRHAERGKENCRQWRALHPGYSRINYLRHRAYQLFRSKMQKKWIRQACPPWCNRLELRAVYKTMCAKNEVEPGAWHVDHIVPLRHPLVCGLHVPWNLQVIPAKENMRKNNLVWPDMPGGL